MDNNDYVNGQNNGLIIGLCMGLNVENKTDGGVLSFVTFNPISIGGQGAYTAKTINLSYINYSLQKIGAYTAKTINLSYINYSLRKIGAYVTQEPIFNFTSNIEIVEDA